MNRRDVLTASPALLAPSLVALPSAAAPDDPILPLYEEWRQARRDWIAAADEPGNGYWNSFASKDAERRQYEAEDAMLELTPTTMAGMAALAHVLWTYEGPGAAPWADDFPEESEAPSAKLIRAIWRAGTGRRDDIATITEAAS